MDEGHQRHGGAVGVPKGEGGVVLEVSLTDHVVGTAVPAVHVVVLAGSHHGVVEGGIEDRALVGIVGFDFHLAQFAVPGGAGGGLDGLEVPAGEFGGHVGLGSFHRDGGEGHLHQHLISFGRLADVIAAVDGLAGSAALAVVGGILADGETRGGAGEFGPEENLLVLGPAAGEAPAAQGGHLAFLVFHHFEAGVLHVVPAAAVLQVEDEGALLMGGESVAVEAHAGGGGHLRPDSVTDKGNAVVAGFGDFLAAVCIAPGAASGLVLTAALGCGEAGDRHHGHVKEVADAGSGKVRMAEADDGVVTVMVTGAPVPALRDAGRAQLHEAEGHVGPYENVAVAAGSNFGIHIGSVVFRGHRSAAGSHHGRRGNKQ